MYSYRKTSNFDLWNGLKRRSKVKKERSREREVCVAFSHTASCPPETRCERRRAMVAQSATHTTDSETATATD